MASYYVRSSDGDNANPGTPADPKATLAGAIAAASTGDNIFASHLHSHDYSDNITLTFKYNKVFSIADWGADTSVTPVYQRGAKERPGSMQIYSITGFCFVAGFDFGPRMAFYRFSTGDDPTFVHLYDCLIHDGGGTGFQITIGDRFREKMSIFEECNIRPNDNQIRLDGGVVFITGGTINHTSTSQPMFRFSIDFTHLTVSGVDMSSAGSLQTLFSIASEQAGLATLSNIRTGGAVISTYPSIHNFGRVTAVNVTDQNTNIQFYSHEHNGNNRIDTGIYATTSPAKFEDAVNYSIRMERNDKSNVLAPLTSEWVHKWYDAGTHTLDVECLVGADGAAALKDNELYLEVDYISGTNSPLGSRATTAPDILDAGTDNPAGTTAWTGDGYAVERTHKLSATVTASKNGYIRYRVCLAKPDTTVFFNPV